MEVHWVVQKAENLAGNLVASKERKSVDVKAGLKVETMADETGDYLAAHWVVLKAVTKVAPMVEH